MPPNRLRPPRARSRTGRTLWPGSGGVYLEGRRAPCTLDPEHTVSFFRALTFLTFVGLVVAGLSSLSPGGDGESAAAASGTGATGEGDAPFAGACAAGDGAGCDGATEDEGTRAASMPAADACSGAGYLCAGLEDSDRIQILHFPDRTGTLSVRVPLPSGEDETVARRLRGAAVRGLEAWQGHPFDLRILSGSRGESADVVVKWVRQLGGRTLGRTELRYRTGRDGTDYRVVGLSLSTRAPGRPSRVADPHTLELTAAHEMGHALGLPHSDDPRDLMYPENTATHPTARDYRTLEALYGIPAGTEIRR